MAYGTGLALCFGTSGLIALLLVFGVVPAGTHLQEGPFLQAGYLFTGLVFLSATWVWWRSNLILRAFKDRPGPQRPGALLRECLVYAVVFETSSLCGLAYWMLVGHQAPRHVWGFVAMTPLLFLSLVPRFPRWARALRD